MSLGDNDQVTGAPQHAVDMLACQKMAFQGAPGLEEEGASRYALPSDTLFPPFPGLAPSVFTGTYSST